MLSELSSLNGFATIILAAEFDKATPLKTPRLQIEVEVAGNGILLSQPVAPLVAVGTLHISKEALLSHMLVEISTLHFLMTMMARNLHILTVSVSISNVVLFQVVAELSQFSNPPTASASVLAKHLQLADVTLLGSRLVPSHLFSAVWAGLVVPLMLLNAAFTEVDSTAGGLTWVAKNQEADGTVSLEERVRLLNKPSVYIPHPLAEGIFAESAHHL